MRNFQRGRIEQIGVLVLVLALNAGCSWLFVQTPRKADETCTTSELAPTVDTVYGYQFTTSAVGGLVLAALSKNNSGLYAGAAAINGLIGAAGLGSAAYGFKKTNSCQHLRTKRSSSRDPPELRQTRRTNARSPSSPSTSSTRSSGPTASPTRRRPATDKSVKNQVPASELPPVEGAETCLGHTCVSAKQCLGGDLCVHSKCLSTDCVGELGGMVGGHLRAEAMERAMMIAAKRSE